MRFGLSALLDGYEDGDTPKETSRGGSEEMYKVSIWRWPLISFTTFEGLEAAFVTGSNPCLASAAVAPEQQSAAAGQVDYLAVATPTQPNAAASPHAAVAAVLRSPPLLCRRNQQRGSHGAARRSLCEHSGRRLRGRRLLLLLGARRWGLQGG